MPAGAAMSWAPKLPPRTAEGSHCRVIMRNGKLLAPMPKLAPPPREMTEAERRVSAFFDLNGRLGEGCRSLERVRPASQDARSTGSGSTP